MSGDGRRFGGRHPLCTCPEEIGAQGFRFVTQMSDCPGGTIAHPPPLTREQLDQIIATRHRER